MTDKPAADFVHLHVHTQYSLLDGAIRINDLLCELANLYDALFGAFVHKRMQL